MDFHFPEGQIYQQLIDYVAQSSEQIFVSLRLCMDLSEGYAFIPCL